MLPSHVVSKECSLWHHLLILLLDLTVFLYFANEAKLFPFPVVHERVISTLGIHRDQHWSSTDYICCGEYIQIGTNRLLFSWHDVSCRQPWGLDVLMYRTDPHFVFLLHYFMSLFLFYYLDNLFFLKEKLVWLWNSNMCVPACVSFSNSQPSDICSQNKVWTFCRWKPSQNVHFNFLQFVVTWWPSIFWGGATLSPLSVRSSNCVW
jgi:hypothetical protein